MGITFGMSNVEGLMNNEGILSFYIGIISIKTMERSDSSNSHYAFANNQLLGNGRKLLGN
jgi:hypothetical protein